MLLATAMILGNVQQHNAPLPKAARMGSSLVLVLVAWEASRVLAPGAVKSFAFAIATGMTLGAIGDFFNAGLLSFIPLSHPVLGGIIAFGLGHIAYILGCWRLAQRFGLTDRRAMGLSIFGWQMIATVAWYFVALCGDQTRTLVWPALPYSLLLAGTAGITAGLALQEARFFLLALGGALFLLSDLILAFGMFHGRGAYGTEAVWLTYGPGQMLIVFSILIAARYSPKQSATCASDVRTQA